MVVIIVFAGDSLSSIEVKKVKLVSIIPAIRKDITFERKAV